VLFVPMLEAPLVRPGEYEVRPWTETEEPVALAGSLASSPSRVAVGDHLWAVFLTRFLGQWPQAEWVPASMITRRLRIRKEEAEIELLREAGRAVDRVMEMIPAQVPFAGRTEREVARDLANLTVDEGHEVAEFTIVASGPNSASPHHHPGERVIRQGDLVVCDFGGTRSGYFSDSTRTFAVGEPSDEQLEAHTIVLEANRRGRAGVAVGKPCEQIDRLVRSFIEEAGLGEAFIHRTGHGIGLEVHEPPYIVDGNRELLDVGMCFSVEPGVYFPERFGVRIEDIVVCTAKGVESLNDSERSLRTVA
jgi:D-alanyl-D-alanine dipeptidase